MLRAGPQARRYPEPVSPSWLPLTKKHFCAQGLTLGTPAACFPRASCPRGRKAVEREATRSHGNLVSGRRPSLLLNSSRSKLLGPEHTWGRHQTRARTSAGGDHTTRARAGRQRGHSWLQGPRGGDGGVGQDGRRVRCPRGASPAEGRPAFLLT